MIGAALALRRETFSRLVELQDPRLDALPVAGIEPDRSRQPMEDWIVAAGREGLQEVGRGAQGGLLERLYGNFRSARPEGFEPPTF